MMGTGLAIALFAAPALSLSPMPKRADKLIALFSAEGCDDRNLRPKLNSMASELARKKSTTRVSVDLPADPERNLDLLGRASPFAAALEVSAAPGNLGELARYVSAGIAPACKADVYLVAERRLITTPRSWPVGTPAPQTKTLVTLKRKPGVSADTFVQEWTGPHATLALAWRQERGGAGHYVQNLVRGEIGADVASIDGIGESEGPGDAPGQEERAARVRTAAHAATFQDLAATQMLVAREVILKD